MPLARRSVSARSRPGLRSETSGDDHVEVFSRSQSSKSDTGAMAAKLHGHTASLLSAQSFIRCLPTLVERLNADLADDPAGDERAADEVRVAVDQLRGRPWDACVGKAPEQLGRDARSFMGWA